MPPLPIIGCNQGTKVPDTKGVQQVSNWQDNNGQKRYSTDVIVEDFEFCENKNVNGVSANSSQTTNSSPAQPSNNNSEFFPIVDDDEELPF